MHSYVAYQCHVHCRVSFPRARPCQVPSLDLPPSHMSCTRLQPCLVRVCAVRASERASEPACARARAYSHTAPQQLQGRLCLPLPTLTPLPPLPPPLPPLLPPPPPKRHRRRGRRRRRQQQQQHIASVSAVTAGAALCVVYALCVESMHFCTCVCIFARAYAFLHVRVHFCTCVRARGCV